MEGLLARGAIDQAADECEMSSDNLSMDVSLLRLVGQAASRSANESTAKRIWNRVLALADGDPEALFYLGDMCRRAGDNATAIRHFQRALQAATTNFNLLNNYGLALTAAGRLDEAEQCFRKAIDLSPDSLEPRANLAQTLFKQQRFAAAANYFDELVERFRIDDASIWANRAIAQIHTHNFNEARASLLKAISLKGDSPDLYSDLGFLGIQSRDYSAATEAFENARRLDPSSLLIQSALIFCRQHLANWEGFDQSVQQLEAGAKIVDENEAQTIVPYGFVTVCDAPDLQAAVARSWMRTQVVATSPTKRVRGRTAQLKLGFVGFELSGQHPVLRLAVELLEKLALRDFSVNVYAVGPASDDDRRLRLQRSVNCFRAISDWEPESLYRTIVADEIDVLFDLNGFTDRTLIDVFRRRPAPMQVNFLGYTGTLGSRAYDWIVSDRYCVRDDQFNFFAERVMRVDPCYMPSDSKREFAADTVSREQYGLPQDAVVLCAFSNIYKIVPSMFDLWMELLREFDQAVLWLRDTSVGVNDRLRSAALERGVAKHRLIFAKAEDERRYLARFRLADCFLDTAPFGGHTTVNDALWAGLPVIAHAGAGFAARASASQVSAAGLHQLIANDFAEYLATARRFIQCEGFRAEATAIVERSKYDSPLFDSDRYVAAFVDSLALAWTKT